MRVHRASRLLLGSIEAIAKTTNPSHQIMLSKALIKPEHKGLYTLLPLGKHHISESSLNSLFARINGTAVC